LYVGKYAQPAEKTLREALAEGGIEAEVELLRRGYKLRY